MFIYILEISHVVGYFLIDGRDGLSATLVAVAVREFRPVVVVVPVEGGVVVTAVVSPFVASVPPQRRSALRALLVSGLGSRSALLL